MKAKTSWTICSRP